MDIAFVNRSLGMRRGGGEIWDLEMARALVTRGIDVTVYMGVPLTGDLDKPVSLPSVEVPSPYLYDLGYAAPVGIGGAIHDLDRYLFARRLPRALAARHDLVHTNGAPELLRISDRIDTPLTIKLNGPPHSLLYDHLHPWKSSYSWLDRAEAVVTTGITTEHVAEHGIDPVTINPGVDTERFSPTGPATETSGPTILWVGRFVPAKNLTALVEAFVTVLGDYPAAELVLVGEGPLEDRLRSRVESLGIDDAVRFEGYVPNDNLPAYYRGADLFALSSRTENHPIALMEAMSCGCPVVAPRLGWIPEMVTDGHDGRLFAPEDTAALADAMLAVLDEPGQLATRARETATAEFSWAQRADRLVEVFERAIE